jgi:hypothetical protein
MELLYIHCKSHDEDIDILIHILFQRKIACLYFYFSFSIIFIYFHLSFLENGFNLKMVASTTETSFNKITFNQKNFHVLLFIYRLKLKQFEKLNGSKSF